MSDDDPRRQALFFSVFEALPRQGPGNLESTRRALALCRELPPRPLVLDLGCGSGAQTLHLSELIDGTVLAVDSHAPSVSRLQAESSRRGLAGRVRAVVGDIACAPAAPESVDLVWSEGALYNLGLDDALRVCRALLHPGGYLAFTDAVWRTDAPPDDVRAAFEREYPGMGTVADDLAAIERAGLSIVGHFELPGEAWWDDFYTPMLRRIAALRVAHAGDAEALGILDDLAREPEMHRRHGHCYAYEFFVARRPSIEPGGRPL